MLRLTFSEHKQPAIIPVIPGRCHRVRAKRGPMTGSASNYGAQLRT
jgi:hypothetical protein